MARHRTTVHQLATEASASIQDTLELLQEQGINVRSGTDYIPKKRIRIARKALALSAQPVNRSKIKVRNLLKVSGAPEKTARVLLREKGVLQDIRQKYIPRRHKALAEKISQEIVSVKTPVLEELTRRTGDLLKRHVFRPREPRVTFEWPLIGSIENLNHVNYDEVIAIHWSLVKEFLLTDDPIDPPGVSDSSLLYSALYRPHTAIHGVLKYPTVAMAGAALLYGIIMDHPFHNGNKRTAFVSLLAFLDRNAWLMDEPNQDEIYDRLICIADHDLNEGDLHLKHPDDECINTARWLHSKIRRLERQERRLKWHDLTRILRGYGARFERGVRGNRLNIYRGEFRTKVQSRNEGDDVSKETMKKIRRDLRFDDSNGYDSRIFYNGGEKIPEFIIKYRYLLDRLAKV